jgi:hypothetical protein
VNRSETLIASSNSASSTLFQIREESLYQISRQVRGRDLIDGFLQSTGGKWHQQGKGVPVTTLRVPRQIALSDKVFQEKATNPRAQ